MESKDGTPIFEVWDKYESIAMHFNDLLIKLRTQSLGGVAAIATVVAIISKNSAGSGFNWTIMAGVFFFLNIFWIAVWILDFKYYNRLLLGAVNALLEIEKLSKTETHITEFNLSKMVENSVLGSTVEIDCKKERKLSFGRTWFYQIIFIGLFSGLILSIYNICW